jgi:hypothetical protein
MTIRNSPNRHQEALGEGHAWPVRPGMYNQPDEFK